MEHSTGSNNALIAPSHAERVTRATTLAIRPAANDGQRKADDDDWLKPESEHAPLHMPSKRKTRGSQKRLVGTSGEQLHVRFAEQAEAISNGAVSSAQHMSATATPHEQQGAAASSATPTVAPAAATPATVVSSGVPMLSAPRPKRSRRWLDELTSSAGSFVSRILLSTGKSAGGRAAELMSRVQSMPAGHGMPVGLGLDAVEHDKAEVDGAGASSVRMPAARRADPDEGSSGSVKRLRLMSEHGTDPGPAGSEEAQGSSGGAAHAAGLRHQPAAAVDPERAMFADDEDGPTATVGLSSRVSTPCLNDALGRAGGHVKSVAERRTAARAHVRKALRTANEEAEAWREDNDASAGSSGPSRTSKGRGKAKASVVGAGAGAGTSAVDVDAPLPVVVSGGAISLHMPRKLSSWPAMPDGSSYSGAATSVTCAAEEAAGSTGPQAAHHDQGQLDAYTASWLASLAAAEASARDAALLSAMEDAVRAMPPPLASPARAGGKGRKKAASTSGANAPSSASTQHLSQPQPKAKAQGKSKPSVPTSGLSKGTGLALGLDALEAYLATVQGSDGQEDKAGHRGGDVEGVGASASSVGASWPSQTSHAAHGSPHIDLATGMVTGMLSHDGVDEWAGHDLDTNAAARGVEDEDEDEDDMPEGLQEALHGRPSGPSLAGHSRLPYTSSASASPLTAALGLDSRDSRHLSAQGARRQPAVCGATVSPAVRPPLDNTDAVTGHVVPRLEDTDVNLGLSLDDTDALQLAELPVDALVGCVDVAM